MKHIIDHTFESDPHEVVTNPDFSALDALYEGRTARYGDYHAHSNSGGTSDGTTLPTEWLQAKHELKLDFVGLMDHRQVRHQYLPEFDPSFFLYGTEPGGKWTTEPPLYCHYLMIFQERESLERVLHQFPDEFQFTGGVEGHFLYLPMSREKFLEIKDAVLAEGGAFVNAHPKQQIKSDKIEDFYFGDGTAIEIIYTDSYADQLNPHTQDNYRLWLDMLAADMRVYNTATADAHYQPKNSGANTVYVKNPICREYVQRLRAGDLNSGYVGIKMSLDGNPTGATVPWQEGMTLQVKIEDAHELMYDPDKKYRVDIHTDRGIAYSAPLTMPFAVALKAQERRFYRVEVLRDEDGGPAAIGNPIFITK